MITIDDLDKIDIKVGKILSAEKMPDSKKLLKLSVDLNETEPRQILSGIAKYFEDPGVLINKKCLFVANIAPRMINGLESNGMILAVSTDDNIPDAGDGSFSLLEIPDNVPVGTKVR